VKVPIVVPSRSSGTPRMVLNPIAR
jgi:hypothetical protein